PTAPLLLLRLRPPRSPLFPYTTLFRSSASRSSAAPSRRRRSCASPTPTSKPPTGTCGGRSSRTRHGHNTKTRRHKDTKTQRGTEDRKSTRLNSSHLVISYAVFCLKKKT